MIIKFSIFPTKYLKRTNPPHPFSCVSYLLLPGASGGGRRGGEEGSAWLGDAPRVTALREEEAGQRRRGEPLPLGHAAPAKGQDRGSGAAHPGGDAAGCWLGKPPHLSASSTLIPAGPTTWQRPAASSASPAKLLPRRQRPLGLLTPQAARPRSIFFLFSPCQRGQGVVFHL